MTGAGKPLTRTQVLTITSAIASITLAGIGLSLSTPLISLILSERGVSGTLIGLNTAVGSLATILLAPLIPRVASKITVGGTLLLALAVATGSLCAFPFFPSLGAWFVLRFFLGAAIGSLFVVSEFWINAAAPEDRRGLVMGIYATALSLGFAIGPALLAYAGKASDALFFVGAAFFLIGAVPVLLAGRGAPPIEGKSSKSAWGFIALAPVATMAGFVFGSVEQGSFAFMALYGQAVGMSVGSAAFLITLFGLGNVLSQIPFGLLADKMDRRKLLLGCALVSLAGTLLMPVASNAWMLGILVFITGGVVGALYTVGLALLGARFRGPELATANAAFVMLYSLGMLVGAPLIGVSYDAMPPQGFVLGMAALLGGYAVLVIVRVASDRT